MQIVSELLLHMVSIRSESRHEEELARQLVRWMQRAGLVAHLDEAGNAVGRLGQGPRHVVLLGHMDTVPGGPEVEIRDGKLYGRGAVDAKGPLAVFLATAARLVQNPPPGLRIDLVGAVEEEISTSKGARFVAQLWRPDACIIGEPSSAGALTLGYKGRLMVDLLRRLPTAHSAAPQANANELMIEDWQRIQQLAAEHNQGVEGLFGRLQTELQSIRSETSHEVGHDNEDRCRATVGFRLPPDVHPDDLENTLRQVLDDRVVAVRGGEQAWVSPRHSPLVRAMSGAIRLITGRRPRLKHKTGTSDMNVVAPIWRCPILAYGPGDSHLDHTPNEHVELTEVRQAVDILEQGLRNYAAQAIDDSTGPSIKTESSTKAVAVHR